MSDRTFVDTNVLIYAHDTDAGRKHEVAKADVNVAFQLEDDSRISFWDRFARYLDIMVECSRARVAALEHKVP